MIRKTFKKPERLAKKKSIQELFVKGSSFYLYPFKIISYTLPVRDTEFHQILISVPKKNHKTAVSRNLLKRRIREAYRLNRHVVTTDKKLLIAYIYTAKEVLNYQQIEKKLKIGLLKINDRYEADHKE